jgi:hypothetical protein
MSHWRGDAGHDMRLQFSTRFLLLAVLLCAIFLALTNQIVKSRRWESRETAMYGILLAIRNYDTMFGGLPPVVLRSEKGTAFHSWRFLVCRPYFGDSVQVSFYGQDASAAYSAGWDSPLNARYCSGPHRDYPESPHSFIADARQHTRFVAVCGSGTAFDSDRQTCLDELDVDTVLVVETANPHWHWMKPGGDLDVRAMDRDGEAGDVLECSIDGDFAVGFADGEVWTLSRHVPSRSLMLFMSIDGAKRHDRDEQLRAYLLHRFQR